MDEPPAVRPLSDAERVQALARFRLLQPYLEGQTSLAAVADAQGMPLRTLQRWVAHYRAQGLVGLVRKRRADRG
jgi:putative transposase